MAMIKVEHLGKQFGDVTVLKDVNAEIHKGEVVAIIGPSGAGKSTFLRCLNLLEQPTSGAIHIDGVNILDGKTDIARVRRKMNMVFQSFNLFAHLTALENLTLAPIKLKGLARGDANANAMALLRLVGLAEKADHYPHELSGGQKQRVAIARCLAMEPEIILFDEPTSALDPTMVSEVLSVIRKLAKDGMTMAIVTHEMAFARDVAHRVFYMDEGGIYEEGTAEQLFEPPQRDKTRAFVNRIRSHTCCITSPDYDLYATQAGIEIFCDKHMLPNETQQNMLLAVEELIGVHRNELHEAPLELTVAYSEKSGALEVICERDGEWGHPLENTNLPDQFGVDIIKGLANSVEYTSDNGKSRLTVQLAASASISS